VRQRAAPLWIDRLDQRVVAALGEQVVLERRLAALQELQRGGARLGVIGADREGLEVAAAVHAIDVDERRELHHAGPTPRGPDVDQPQFRRVVAHQLPDPLGVDALERDGLLGPLLAALLDPVALLRPLDRAAEDLGLFHRHRPSSEQRVDGIARVAHADLGRVLAVVDAPHEAQPPLEVEDKDVRRGCGSVAARDGLRLTVVEVREREAALLGADDHFLQRVAQVGVAQLVEPHGLGVVRRDGHERDAPVLEVRRELLDAFLVRLRGRTVIGREDQHEDLGRREISQAMVAAIDSGQVEVGRGLAQGQRLDGRGLLRSEGHGTQTGQQEQPCGSDAHADRSFEGHPHSPLWAIVGA
jgi:hypothetical protein